jgi:hypothetical protein
VNNVPQHDELPLPDYDHLPTGTLPSRISGLNEADLTQVLAYERAHANRLPVIQILEHRLTALQNGAEPSGTTVPSTGIGPNAARVPGDSGDLGAADKSALTGGPDQPSATALTRGALARPAGLSARHHPLGFPTALGFPTGSDTVRRTTLWGAC